MPIRVGLIGAGWAARAVHGPSLRDYRRRRRGIQLAAVCDVDADRAEALRKDFGFAAAYTSVEQLLADGAIDAAVVAVSAAHNAPVAVACVAAGLPVLLEKPPAMTARAARRLARDIAAHDGRVTVAFNRRFTPALVRLKELVAEVGPVQSLRCDMRRTDRREPDFSTTAIHALDTLRFLGGDVARMELRYAACGAPGEVTTFHGLGTTVGGATVGFDIVPVAGETVERYTLCAGGRTFEATSAAGHVTVRDGGSVREVKVRRPSEQQHDTSGFYQEVAAFLDAAKGEAAPPGPSVAETVESVTLMEALARRRLRYRRT